MVSREEEPPHTSHHGAREISIGKNKYMRDYKKNIKIREIRNMQGRESTSIILEITIDQNIENSLTKPY